LDRIRDGSDGSVQLSKSGVKIVAQRFILGRELRINPARQVTIGKTLQAFTERGGGYPKLLGFTCDTSLFSN
jgi:hypothetical protein